MIRRIAYASLPVLLGLIAVLAWPVDTRDSAETAVASPGDEREPGQGEGERSQRTKNLVGMALKAVERARMEPQAQIQRSLSEFDRFVIKDRRAANLKGAIMDAMDERNAVLKMTCPEFFDLQNTTMELVFQVSARHDHATSGTPLYAC